jgi:hypothetical protein
MRRRIPWLCILFTMAVTIGSAAGTASAGRLSFSSRDFRIVWRFMQFREASNSVQCPVTLEGSLHSSTVTKTFSSLIGYITRASTASASCINGRLTVLTETLPWHVRYSSFSGTLPNISGVEVRIVGLAFRIGYTFVNCLIRSESIEPAVLRLNREAAGVLTPSWNSTFQITQREVGCFSSPIELVESGVMTRLNSGAGVTLTLI